MDFGKILEIVIRRQTVRETVTDTHIHKPISRQAEKEPGMETKRPIY